MCDKWLLTRAMVAVQGAPLVAGTLIYAPWCRPAMPKFFRRRTLLPLSAFRGSTRRIWGARRFHISRFGSQQQQARADDQHPGGPKAGGKRLPLRRMSLFYLSLDNFLVDLVLMLIFCLQVDWPQLGMTPLRRGILCQLVSVRSCLLL